MKIEKTQYGGWPNCFRISNGEVDLVVTADVGPRIIRYGFAGGPNLFKEFDGQLGQSREFTWQARGGHRMWMAPEDPVLSYALDNEAIQAEVNGHIIELTGGIEKETGLEKRISLTLAPEGSHVEVTHRIANRGSRPREFAVWALTMMAPGGVGIIAFPPRGSHPRDLAPTHPLVMWPYTDFSDQRWKFTKRYLLLRQDRATSEPQKAGLFLRETAAAYLLGSNLFVKRATARDPARQPDFGCSCETFVNEQFLELETLGEVASVPSGGSLSHTEHWSLHGGVTIADWTDDAIDGVILPIGKLDAAARAQRG